MSFQTLALAVALSVIQPQQTYSLGSNPKWTHWAIESSTDLIHWRNRNDLELQVWPDGKNCTVIVHATEQREFFRTVGDFEQ